MAMKEVVTAYRQNAIFAFMLENEMLESETEVYFREVNDKTEIISVNKVHGKNVIWRSVFILMKGHFEENGEKIYMNLKKVIEDS